MPADSLRLGLGDTLITYTDGVTDAINPQEEQFGLSRLMDLFATKPPTNAGATVNDVVAAVKRFAAEQDQFDDVTCLVLQRLAARITAVIRELLIPPQLDALGTMADTVAEVAAAEGLDTGS